MVILCVTLFSTQSVPQWYVYRPKGISTETIVTIGDTVYAGTATDGLFASTDDGNTWFALNLESK